MRPQSTPFSYIVLGAVVGVFVVCGGCFSAFFWLVTIPARVHAQHANPHVVQSGHAPVPPPPTVPPQTPAAKLDPDKCLAGTGTCEPIKGEYSWENKLVVRMEITNLTQWQITGFQGTVEMFNPYNESLFTGSLDEYPDLAGNGVYQTKGTFKPSLFTSNQIFGTPSDQIRLEFHFDKIVFADGTVVTNSGY